MEGWQGREAEPPLEALAPRVGVDPGGVDVRDLGNRWGSRGRAGILNFNWDTILLVPSVVEYVVGHELVHLRQKTHKPDF